MELTLKKACLYVASHEGVLNTKKIDEVEDHQFEDTYKNWCMDMQSDELIALQDKVIILEKSLNSMDRHVGEELRHLWGDIMSNRMEVCNEG